MHDEASGQVLERGSEAGSGALEVVSDPGSGPRPGFLTFTGLYLLVPLALRHPRTRGPAPRFAGSPTAELLGSIWFELSTGISPTCASARLLAVGGVIGPGAAPQNRSRGLAAGRA